MDDGKANLAGESSDVEKDKINALWEQLNAKSSTPTVGRNAGVPAFGVASRPLKSGETATKSTKAVPVTSSAHHRHHDHKPTTRTCCASLNVSTVKYVLGYGRKDQAQVDNVPRGRATFRPCPPFPPPPEGARVLTQCQPVPASPSQQTRNANSPAANPTPAANNEGRKISCEDIQLVQNLIERCLQLYMNQNEVITTLKYQAKIEPGFTSLVWQKLEEQNPDFFKAYYTRLKVKKQIVLFNHLLEQQVQLQQKMRMFPPGNMVQSMQNVHHMPIGYTMPPGPPNTAIPHMGVILMPVPGSNMMNGAGNPMPESFPSHGSPGSAPMFPFSNMGNPTDISGMGMGLNTTMGLETPFVSNDPVSNGIGQLSTTEADSSSTRESLESLGQLPRNFSLSDLTAELTSSADLGALGSYTGSPFLTPDTEVYLQSPDKEFSGWGEDDKMLDSMGETLNMDFGDLNV